MVNSMQLFSFCHFPLFGKEIEFFLRFFLKIGHVRFFFIVVFHHRAFLVLLGFYFFYVVDCLKELGFEVLIFFSFFIHSCIDILGFYILKLCTGDDIFERYDIPFISFLGKVHLRGGFRFYFVHVFI